MQTVPGDSALETTSPAEAARTARLGRVMVTCLPALRRYAIGLSGSAAAGDDLVQDCIEQALRRLGTLQDEARMAAWLRSILFNGFIDERRRLRSRGETAEMEVLEGVMDGRSQPDREYELRQVLRAAAGLTLQHRQVLLLVGVEGLSYREVSEELDVPIGTVMSRLARARGQLQQALASVRPRVAAQG